MPDLFPVFSTWFETPPDISNDQLDRLLEEFIFRQKVIDQWLHGEAQISLDDVECLLAEQGVDPYQWAESAQDNLEFIGIV